MSKQYICRSIESYCGEDESSKQESGRPRKIDKMEEVFKTLIDKKEGMVDVEDWKCNHIRCSKLSCCRDNND